MTYRLTDLLATTYFVSVSAISLSGEESSCSNEASGLAGDALVVTPLGGVNFGSVEAGASASR